MLDDPGPPARAVDVGVCTFRRASVEATIESVAAQELPAGVAVRVIVADNDEIPSAKASVEAAGARLGLDLLYVHAPARNISVARNACLDAGTAPLLAFIDDDETASPGWLAALLARMDETGADAVLGPVRAVYPDDLPPWVGRADLHSTRPPAPGAIRTGYSGNVLLRRATFGNARFDPALGRTGGEDDRYFADAVRRGAVIAYAPDALADEPVPPGRASLRWLCRRSFRNGQTHAGNRLAAGAGRPAAFLLAAAKAGACAAGALATLPSPVRWRRFAVRGALHAGACARYLGRRELRLY